MTTARPPARASSPPLSSGLIGGVPRGTRGGVASGPPSRSVGLARRQAAGSLTGARGLATSPRRSAALPASPVFYDRRSTNLAAPRRSSGVASPPAFNPPPRVSAPASSSAASSGAADAPRGPRPSPSARPAPAAVAQYSDECPPRQGTPPLPLSRSPPRFTPSGAARSSVQTSPRAPPEPSFSPPRPSGASAPPRSSSRAPPRQTPHVSPPSQPMPPDEDTFFDMVLPCGLYQDEVMDVMYRELGPEDFEMLSKLDESVPRRNTVQRDSVDQLCTRVAADTLETDATCGVCLSEFERTGPAAVLPCGHAFHSRCISRWLTQFKNTCPLCSAPIANDSGSLPV